jgi:2-hydroxychromene-2-carboxylate isomerase
MTVSRAPLRFCFDFVSPYAYLAWTQIHAVAERHGRAVEPVPVVFGAILDACGQKGPAEIPSKRAYLFKNCVRLAHGFGVPFAPPPAHPFNPLLALRTSLLPMPEPTRRALVDRLFVAAWGGGGGIAEPADVAAAASAVGLDGDQLVHSAGAPAIKDLLRRNTDEALAAGAFGVPTMFADGELFWGVDALGHLERFLEGHDPVSAELVAQWATLPAAAIRRSARG